MIVAKNCDFWSVFPQISCGRYPPNSSKFPKPHFLLTCTYFRGRRHGRNLPMAKATDGLAFGITRHCRIEGLPPMPPTPGSEMCQAEAGHCLFLQGIVCQLTGLWMLSLLPIHISSGLILTLCLEQAIVSLLLVQHWQNSSFAWRHRKQQSTWKWSLNVHMLHLSCLAWWWHRYGIEWFAGKSAMFHMSKFSLWRGSLGRPPTPAGPKSVYTCPYCKTAVQSTVQTGKVFTRNHCGKQFRVKDGQVIRSYQHACPHCGATVVSTKAKGRIQVQHTMPNGQPCETTQWKASGENTPGHATWCPQPLAQQ